LTQSTGRRPSGGPEAKRRAAAEALDAADPLGGFRDRFVIDDPSIVYLDGNSLGPLPVVTRQRIAEVVKEWDEPTFEEFDQRNAWRLFNATTFALHGRIAENPGITRRLHTVIDGVCERIN